MRLVIRTCALSGHARVNALRSRAASFLHQVVKAAVALRGDGDLIIPANGIKFAVNSQSCGCIVFTYWIGIFRYIGKLSKRQAFLSVIFADLVRLFVPFIRLRAILFTF